MTGILVTPDLRPLPGRADLETQHESFDRVKRVLHKLLASKFLEVAQKNPKLFAKIQDDHGTLLLEGLSTERMLADKDKRDYIEGELLRYIRFWRYSKKYLQGNACTLNGYLGLTHEVSLDTREKNRKIYFVPRPVPPNRQREFLTLLTSSNVEVIVPQNLTESMLLAVINDTFKDVSLQSVETDLLARYAGILQGEQRQRWSLILKYFTLLTGGHGMKSADIGALQPDYMPAMVLNMPGEEQDEKENAGIQGNSEELKPTILLHLPAEPAKALFADCRHQYSERRYEGPA